MPCRRVVAGGRAVSPSCRGRACRAECRGVPCRGVPSRAGEKQSRRAGGETGQSARGGTAASSKTPGRRWEAAMRRTAMEGNLPSSTPSTYRYAPTRRAHGPALAQCVARVAVHCAAPPCGTATSEHLRAPAAPRPGGTVPAPHAGTATGGCDSRVAARADRPTAFFAPQGGRHETSWPVRVRVPGYKQLELGRRRRVAAGARAVAGPSPTCLSVDHVFARLPIPRRTSFEKAADLSPPSRRPQSAEPKASVAEPPRCSARLRRLCPPASPAPAGLASDGGLCLPCGYAPPATAA